MDTIICTILLSLLSSTIGGFGCRYYYHPRVTTNEEKQNIRKYGIVHYTKAQNVDAILKEQCIKSRSRFRKKTYFFLNVPQTRDVLRLNGTLHKSTKVQIQNLTEIQINSLKKRRCDLALVSESEFVITTENKIKTIENDRKSYKAISIKFIFRRIAYFFFMFLLILGIMTILLVIFLFSEYYLNR